MTAYLPIKLEYLQDSLPLKDAVSIELVENIPIFRASSFVIEQIETLLAKQKEVTLTKEEENELDKYEELDDYLSLINRMVCNMWVNTTLQ